MNKYNTESPKELSIFITESNHKKDVKFKQKMWNLS